MIKELSPKFVDQVVKVHIEAFPDSQSTKFGKEFLKSYYAGAANSPNSVSFLWVIDGVVAGFIFGGINKKKHSRQILMRSKTRLIKSVINNIILNPVTSIKRFWSYLVHYIMPSGDTFYSDDTATLDSVAILTKFRGQGIADALMKAFLEKLKYSQVRACRLGVLAENKVARSFYERSGFKQLNKEGTIYLIVFDEKFKIENQKTKKIKTTIYEK